MIAPGARSLAAGLVACALLSGSPAHGKGIIIITHGETISHVGNAGAPAAQAMVPGQIGYKYDYFGIFWIDLWTSGGTYCVYDGNNYAPIEPAVAAQLLGQSDVSPPFLYRVPLGWLIFGPLIAIGIVVAIRKKHNQVDVVRLLRDERYQKALAVLNAEYERLPPPAAPEPGAEPPADERFHTAFEAGVRHLIDVGVPRAAAERNLAVVVQAIAQVPRDGAGKPGEAG